MAHIRHEDMQIAAAQERGTTSGIHSEADILDGRICKSDRSKVMDLATHLAPYINASLAVQGIQKR